MWQDFIVLGTVNVGYDSVDESMNFRLLRLSLLENEEKNPKYRH